MAKKTIIIIGAGLAGLAMGCYAQMNGYKPVFSRCKQSPAEFAFHGSAMATFLTTQSTTFSALPLTQ